MMDDEADNSFFRSWLFVTIGTFVWLGWCVLQLPDARRITQRLIKVWRFFKEPLPSKCTAIFNWDTPAIVGNTVSFVIKFNQWNGRPYSVNDNNNTLAINISVGVSQIRHVIEYGGEPTKDSNCATCNFIPRVSGVYHIAVTIKNKNIAGSPFLHTFLPAPTELSKIAIIQQTSTIVCTSDISNYFVIEPRDAYGNICFFNDESDTCKDYNLTMKKADSNDEVNGNSTVQYDSISKRFQVTFILSITGFYTATVTYCGALIPDGNFSVIVLCRSDMKFVQNIIQKKSNDGFEARLISHNGVKLTKAKKVYCFVTAKQLYINEYILMVIPRRLATFRLYPLTKFTADSGPEGGMTIYGGSQPSVCLASSQQGVIAALFNEYMLRNIGWSETFEDKRSHFNYKLREYHFNNSHCAFAVKIDRNCLVETSFKTTNHLSTSYWCRSFHVEFMNERGLDFGGLRKEWLDILCKDLFSPSGGLFRQFHEGTQALVHPNANRPKHLKLKMYEFCGKVVGKCIYESALGKCFAVCVPARFTRSFLAQLIGLRVHYGHFASDDPELYKGKISHILKNDPESIGEQIYFTDDYIDYYGDTKTVELIPGGAVIKVTEDNKLDYLDALAQYRMSISVRPEIQSFIAGLHCLIPDHLLCFFDENELELLMCGMDKYSVNDFKKNYTIDTTARGFDRVLKWFWTAVTNFTDEEMARLLQFITGCSRLPPGGFADLMPKIHIVPSHNFASLPTAHTCLNQICLPDHENYENFEKSLLLAVREGSTGYQFF